MTEELATQYAQQQDIVSAVQSALITGDLSGLSEEQRVGYYLKVCESVGLNPFTKPLEYIQMDGPDNTKKTVLYATKDAAAQLRSKHGIDVTKVEKEVDGDTGLIFVTVYGRNAAGRQDSEMGVVSIVGYKKGGGTYQLTGDRLANAYMKAITKAKRRLALSLCGLGWMDETEIETIPNAQVLQTQLPEVLPPPQSVPDDYFEGDVIPSAADRSKDKSLGHSEIIAEIGEEMKRIGWVRAQAKVYCFNQFGKESSKELDESELRQMLNDLQVMETKAEVEA